MSNPNKELNTMKKVTRRVITLSSRAPVTIIDSAWPIVVSESEKDWDGQHEAQANETSQWFLAMREHEDGRAIVYATYSFTSHYRGYQAKAGRVLDADSTQSDRIAAIEEVAEDIAMFDHHDCDSTRWKSLAAACIAKLPAEDLG